MHLFATYDGKSIQNTCALMHKLREGNPSELHMHQYTAYGENPPWIHENQYTTYEEKTSMNACAPIHNLRGEIQRDYMYTRTYLTSLLFYQFVMNSIVVRGLFVTTKFLFYGTLNKIEEYDQCLKLSLLTLFMNFKR